MSRVEEILDEFRGHVDEGARELRRGDLESALVCFERALDCARSSDDPDLVDLAECNRSAILIELGEERDQLPTMRSILLRSADAQNCMVAATNAARVYDLVKDFKKALFYARVASNHADAVGDASQRASVANLVGNLLITDSAVDEAALSYEQALEMMPDDDPVWRARAVGNLGYCRILQGKVREALSLLQKSVAELRSLAARPYLISPLLDLAFALLEADKPGQARPVAEEGLALAEELEDLDARKNALYLLGEAASLEGDIETARHCFGELQQRFYPDKPFVSEFLLSVDVRKVVNLRA